jgi:hypothetical protein
VPAARAAFRIAEEILGLAADFGLCCRFDPGLD